MKPSEEEMKRFQRKGHDVERLLALKKRLGAEMGEDPETLMFDKIKESR